MIKVEIENIVNGRRFGARFETMGLAEEWIENQVKKCSWGHPQRDIHEDEMSEIEKQRVLTKKKGEDGKYICNVRADYEISIYQDSVYKQKRRKEYPSFDEVIEAIIENMEMRPQKLEMIKHKRAQVRQKYPKDEKELLEKR